MKVLVTRTDRLGDLVLSLPVIDYLHQIHPDWELQRPTARGIIGFVLVSVAVGALIGGVLWLVRIVA